MDNLEVEATVTRRGQTTVPSVIRKVLNVTAGESKIVYRVLPDGTVILSKKDVGSDPVIAEFLAFIATDTSNNAAGLRPVTGEWLSALRDLVEGVAFDIDAPLSADDE